MKGQQLIREGSVADGIYVINKGIVKVYVKGYRARPFIFYLGTKGDMLGYQTDDNGKHQVSVASVEETEVCFIENKDFELVLQKNVGVREDLTKEFNKELSKIHMRTVRLAQMSVREKIADVLLHIAAVYQPGQTNKAFEINLDREDIGNLIGCTKEQVSKKFSDLKEGKLIAASGKHLQILNYDKLKTIAGL